MTEQVTTKQERQQRKQRRVWEGTREELALHAEELLANLPAGQSLRVYALGAAPDRKGGVAANDRTATTPAKKSAQNSPGIKHTSSYGKYAHILRPSEEFIQEKQDEIAREERRLR